MQRWYILKVGCNASGEGSNAMPSLHDGIAATEVTELAAEDVEATVDAEARRCLGISGRDFATKWRNGDYNNDPNPHITRIAMLLPDAW